MNMTRLQAELQRLYGSLPCQATEADDGLRAAALELSEPADWQAMGQLWRGVQADLGLPAPAIAVSGRNGYQLWFSFAQPLPASRAAAFLEALRLRYLGDLAAGRLACLPARADADQAAALTLPPQQLTPERWSAFVAPDLAPVFAEEPWLDTAPGMEGQADLLMRLESIQSAGLGVALERLGGVPAAVMSVPVPVPGDAATDAPMQQARQFLLAVMNDESVALALRIEAAKALLTTCCCSPRP